MKNLFFIFLVLPLFLKGQINESDSLKWKGKLDINGFYQRGNVETIIFRTTAELSYAILEKWVFKTKNSYVYQEFGKQKADEDILSLNFLYFDPKRKIYPLVLGFVSTNFRREIDLRYLLGGGVSFQILNKKKDWLKCSISSEYEHTDFMTANFNRIEYNGNQTINTIRGTLWINGEYHLFDNKIILSHESYLQPSLEDQNNYRWKADVGVAFPISKYFNLKISYLHAFESIVIASQKREDSFFTFGFSLKSF